jgi:exodeoxyribonuclease VII large subunit
MLDTRADQVTTLRDRAGRTLRHRLDRAATELHHTLARLRALSPAATLERGYAIVQRADNGAVLRDPADAADGDAVRLRLAGGELAARVTAMTGSTP